LYERCIPVTIYAAVSGESEGKRSIIGVAYK